MRDRRGFALLMALWLLVAVGGFLAVDAVPHRSAGEAARNRIMLRQAGWSRDACQAIALAQIDRGEVPVRGDSSSLGRRRWCRAWIEDPSARININLADASTLRAVLGADSLVDALIDWRDADAIPQPQGSEEQFYQRSGRTAPRNAPFQSVEELRLVRGFEARADTALRRLFTVDGNGLVNLNTSSLELLTALGLPEQDAQRLIGRRSMGWQVTAATDLAAEGITLPPGLLAIAGYGTPYILVVSEGWVSGAYPRAWARSAVEARPNGGARIIWTDAW